MQIGPYTLYSIETSEFALDGGAMFGIIPKPLWEKKAPSGGNTQLIDGRLEPTFQNATYWVQSENWELANSPSEKDAGSFMSDDWSVLEENEMIQFVDGKESFLPGIENHLTYGHTTGMMHPIIGDSSQKLIYMADLIPMAAHIPLPWVMAYDIHPVQTVEEKREILPKIVDEEWTIFFEHDPVFQAAKVDFDGKHYQLKEGVTISE